MSAPPAAGPVPGPDELRMFWWLHDARWYQGVAKRFGQDAANEINAEAVQFVAKRVATWYARTHGITADLPTPELSDVLETISRLMWSDDMVEARNEVLGDDSWETVVSKNFNLRMLAAAGSLDGYDCPCLPMRAGWFDGLGLRTEDSCIECQRTGGEVCRFRARRLPPP
ncbi:MAG: hypothetical protein QOI35_2328 [Cryptosporangiaceae bacterium]|nr:hypothetical protein [Cryptosporangiaceae bacterium]